MSHYDIHVGDVIKYPEMVMARTGNTRLTILTSKELKYNLLTFIIFIIQSQVGAIPVFSR